MGRRQPGVFGPAMRPSSSAEADRPIPEGERPVFLNLAGGIDNGSEGEPSEDPSDADSLHADAGQIVDAEARHRAAP